MELTKKDIKCPNCGKNLKYIADLTEDELDSYLYLSNLKVTVNQALRSDSIDLSLFKDNQVYEYYSSLYHQLAESSFLLELLYRSIRSRLNLHSDMKLEIVNNCIYQHQ
jgi:hypothetical protein